MRYADGEIFAEVVLLINPYHRVVLGRLQQRKRQLEGNQREGMLSKQHTASHYADLPTQLGCNVSADYFYLGHSFSNC